MCSPRTKLIYFVICLVGMIETMLTVASEHIVNRNHPFYISVCSITHNIDTNTLEISFQFFTDDLEQALEINGTGQIYLGEKHEAKKANEYISRYIALNTNLEINGTRRHPIFLGKEIDTQLTWCYLEISNVSVLNSIILKNTLLFDISENQINLVHIKINNQKKTLIFNKQQIEQVIKL